MKKSLNVFLIAVVIILAQACGSKSEKNIDESSVKPAEVPLKPVVLTVAEKRAKLEMERSVRAAKRRIALEERAKKTPTYTDSEGNVVYYKPELEPSFIGGEKAMMEYLRDNIQFPKDAQEKGVEGTVFVDFIVVANGSVREVEVTDATNEDVDQSLRTEAIRVVTAMPNWIPGRQRGKAVDVKFSLPITFEIN